MVLGRKRPCVKILCFICICTSFYFVCFRGKNVLNQKSELEKALSKHKEKQILNQVKEHRETPGNRLLNVVVIPFIIDYCLLCLYNRNTENEATSHNLSDAFW